MKVAIYLADQNPNVGKSIGIGYVTSTVLDTLQNHAADLEMVEIGSKSSIGQDESIRWHTDHTLGRVAADQLHRLFSRKDFDGWFYPKGYLPFAAPKDRPTIGYVHDTIVDYYRRTYPDMRSEMEWTYWRHLLKHSLQNFTHILTPSEHAKAQIQEFCRHQRIESAPVTVVPPAIVAPNNLWSFTPQSYALHLCSSLPHKRTDDFLKLWTSSIKKGVELPPLKLVGELSPVAKNLLDEGKGSIVHAPFLERDEYWRVLSQASVLIVASEIEGFGLPAIESSLVGTPVAYASGTAVSEVLDQSHVEESFQMTGSSIQVAVKYCMDLQEIDLVERAQIYRERHSIAQLSAALDPIFFEVFDD